MDQLIPQAQNAFGLPVTPDQAAAFQKYTGLLMDWNTRLNLTGIRDLEQIRIRHFLDSLSCFVALNDTPHQRVVDVGTGAGFPGVVLKIMRPEMQLTLVESVAKKTRFLETLTASLELANVEILTKRAEDVGRMEAHRETYDWAVARAVASLAVVAEYLLPLVCLGGRILVQMGQTAPEEVRAAENAFTSLGGKFLHLIPVALPGLEAARYLVVVEKVSKTPERYPRRVGIPAKRPL